MTWLRLDDTFAEHPKVDRLSDGAFRLHVAGMCYSARHLTDGFVPAERAARLVPRYKRTYVAELVVADLWHEADGGWVIHDFLTYNPSAEKVKTEREAAADRMRRLRSGERSPEQPPERSPARSGTPSRPDPSRSKSSSSLQPVVPAPVTDDEVPPDVWQEYARLKRAAASAPVQNIAAYDRATIANARVELAETAARWWRDFDVRPRDVAAALVDGKAGRYWTRRQAAS